MLPNLPGFLSIVSPLTLVPGPILVEQFCLVLLPLLH